VSKTFNYDFAALVIYDALILGDSFVVEKYGVNRRTVQRYRKRFKTDSILSQKVAELRKAIQEPYKPTAKDAMDAAIGFIQDAPKHLDPSKVGDILAIAQAYKTIGEIELAGKIIDARLAQVSGQLGTTDRQMASTTVDTTATTVGPG
jgi:hypothetical protein